MMKVPYQLFVFVCLEILLINFKVDCFGFGASLGTTERDHEYGTHGISSPFGGIGINTEDSNSIYAGNNFFDTFRSSIFDDYTQPKPVRATSSMLRINHGLTKLSQKRAVSDAFTKQEFNEMVTEYSAARNLGLI